MIRNLFKSKRLSMAKLCQNISTTKIAQIPQKRWTIGTWLCISTGTAFFLGLQGSRIRLNQASLTTSNWNSFLTKKPQNHDEWQQEYEQYKETAEYKQRPISFTLYKKRFVFSYYHQLAASVSLPFYYIPLLYFQYNKWISSPCLRMLHIAGMVGVTTALSGILMQTQARNLPVNTKKRHSLISSYGHSFHATLGNMFYCLQFWNTSNYFKKPLKIPDNQWKGVKVIKKQTILFIILLAINTITGSILSGVNDKKQINTPENLFTLSPAYRNLFENKEMVVHNHIKFALITLGLSGYFAFTGARLYLPKHIQYLTSLQFILLNFQAFTGFVESNSIVEQSLHEANSLAIWSTTLYILNSTIKVI